jgi:hypothetical protein
MIRCVRKCGWHIDRNVTSSHGMFVAGSEYVYVIRLIVVFIECLLWCIKYGNYVIPHDMWWLYMERYHQWPLGMYSLGLKWDTSDIRYVAVKIIIIIIYIYIYTHTHTHTHTYIQGDQKVSVHNTRLSWLNLTAWQLTARARGTLDSH